MTTPERKPLINDNPVLQRYYDTLESRIGYHLVLGDTRHFGYYEKPTKWPFPISPALRAMEARVLAALSLPPGSKVLDAGCGVGHVALYMARNGDLRVEAIDVVAHHVEKAKRNVCTAGQQHLINARQMDYHHLELLPDASFDGVYTMETLVHATDADAVAREFFRVLKPGGVLVNMEYEYAKIPPAASNSWVVLEMGRVNKLAAMPSYSKFEYGVIRDTMLKAGFERVQCNDLTKNVEPMLWLFYVMAFLPYHLFVKPFGLEEYFTNTVAGVVIWHWRKYGRYMEVISYKPADSERPGTRQRDGVERRR